MAIQVQMRRGTTADNSSFTGAVGEVTVDTDKDTLVVHDGATAGGFPLAKESGSALSPSSLSLTSGTANGVVYLNGSKVATSGSELVFDGTNLGVGTSSLQAKFNVINSSGLTAQFRGLGSNSAGILGGIAHNATGFGTYVDGSGYGHGFISLGHPGDDGRDFAIGTASSADTSSATFLPRMTFKPSGNVILNSGNLVIGTSGKGIDFTTSGTFAINGSERLRIDSSGNVGIGTSSPSPYLTTKVLHISDANGGSFRFGTATEQAILACTSSEIALGTGQSLPIKFLTNALERLRIDSSGNLGLGVTPSAWNAGFRSLDLSSTGAVFGRNNANQTGLAFNSYLDSVGNWIYRASAPASLALQNNGAFEWRQAPSGTAGNTISFTQAMTLTAAGNLGIGTSSPSASAILDAQSTTKGVRMPNMTTAQKNAIASPAAGLMVFDTTLSKLCVYTGAAWETVTSI